MNGWRLDPAGRNKKAPRPKESEGHGASVSRRRERVDPVVSRQPCGWWWQSAAQPAGALLVLAQWCSRRPWATERAR